MIINKIGNILSSLKFKNLEFQDILKFHLDLAEKISSNNEIIASNIFWNNSKAGNELLEFFNELIKESIDYGKIQTCDEYSYLLDYLIAENSYSDRYFIHPMINIISPQERRDHKTPETLFGIIYLLFRL